MTAAISTEPIPTTAPSSPRIRIFHRDAAGKIDMNWPFDKIGEAITDQTCTLWVDIERPDLDLPRIEALFRDVFAFHPLAIEDALKESHVPKLDDWGNYLYLVFHGLDFDPDTDHLRLHELDLFLGMNYLVSCHAVPMKPIDTLRRQIERDPERGCKGPDHLLYHILDLGTEEYLSAITHLDEAIDTAQEEVFEAPTPETLQQIFRVKRSAVKVHRILSPQREVLNRLARDAYPQIDAPDRVYFRDVYDHLVRLHDISETLRDLVSGALDTYLSAISNRTNDIMKTFTLVTVMFLPMSFLAGFFGMNFFGDNMVLPHALPRVAFFWINFLAMVLTPPTIYFWAKRRGWF